MSFIRQSDFERKSDDFPTDETAMSLTCCCSSAFLIDLAPGGLLCCLAALLALLPCWWLPCLPCCSAAALPCWLLCLPCSTAPLLPSWPPQPCLPTYHSYQVLHKPVHWARCTMCCVYSFFLSSERAWTYFNFLDVNNTI